MTIENDNHNRKRTTKRQKEKKNKLNSGSHNFHFLLLQQFLLEVGEDIFQRLAFAAELFSEAVLLVLGHFRCWCQDMKVEVSNGDVGWNVETQLVVLLLND